MYDFTIKCILFLIIDRMRKIKKIIYILYIFIFQDFYMNISNVSQNLNEVCLYVLNYLYSNRIRSTKYRILI